MRGIIDTLIAIIVLGALVGVVAFTLITMTNMVLNLQ